MPATRQRPPGRRTRSADEPVWVIDLAAAEAKRATQPGAPAAKQRWLLWLGTVAGAVWVYDVVSLLVQVRP
jgi:hypothetical protein